MFLKSIFILLILELFNFSECKLKINDETATVETKLGQIKGYKSYSRQQNPFFTFKGIPYANVVKRFQPAEPIKKLNVATFDANTFGAVCPQNYQNDFDENCLFLNIYTPTKVKSNNKPVIVFIHGGSLKTGSGNFENPEYFMDEDVILVTINYRLGAFGFLTTANNEKTVPNLGIKDCVLALKWVQDNIGAFGGNKNKVTLMAQSAGAALASLMLASPNSKGLYQRVILQSAAILDPWIYRSQSLNDKIAFQLNDALGCESTNDTDKIIDCFMSKTTKEIITAQSNLPSWYYNPLVPFWPIIEEEGPGTFICQDPMISLKKGKFNKVPVIITLTKDEGLLLQSIAIATNEKELLEIEADWNNTMPNPLTLTIESNSKFSNFEPDVKNQITDSIRKFYFDSDKFVYSPSIDRRTLDRFTNLFSDRYFNYGAQKTALGLAKYVPVYTGIFTRPGNDSMIRVYGVSENYGVSHGDEMQFFFPEFGYGPFPISDELNEYSKVLVKTWVSFASNGVPSIQIAKGKKVKTVKWPKVGKSEVRSENVEWLDLGKLPFELNMMSKPFGDRLSFWDDYYDKVSTL